MRLQGAFVAITTPFRAAGSLDEPALAAHARWLVERGVDGIVVCGTTGESATLENEEKRRACQVVLEAVGGEGKVIAGIGNNSTSETLAQLDLVRDLSGLAAIMCVVPYYNRPPQAGLAAHFSAIADASRHPLVVYNVPSRTVASLSVETMATLSAHPNVIAFKEATGDLYMNSRLVQAVDPKVSLLSGDDPTALPFLAIGGHGVISVAGNIAPSVVSGMCRAFERGDLDEARRLHQVIVALQGLLFSTSSPIPVKAAAAHLGFGDGSLRLPLVALAPEERAALVASLEALGVRR